jgi:anti-sigma regulatory factor (Ser/Thr protein kinase)
MLEVYSKNIIISNTINEAKIAVILFEAFAKLVEIPIFLMEKVNTMMNELLSNIIKYGFPNKKAGKITIALELFDTGKLSIKMTDKGVPFNPFQITPPNTKIPIEDRETGGLGIHLVRKLMDEFSYKRMTDRNVILMSKNQV